jgi:ribose transport system ATP-binding protein
MSFVHQNLGLVPSLTVLENLRFVQLTSATSGFINWRDERSAAREALTRFGLDLDPDERVDRISAVERALLAIVRAFEDIEAARRLTGKPGLLLLDEPTPFLPAAGVAKLFALIRSIARLGSGVIFISHDIDEVMQITDRATILRDGVVAGELRTAAASHSQIVEMIVGRDLAKRPPVSHTKSIARPVLARIDNASGKRLRPTNLVIGRGEILGHTGLIGLRRGSLSRVWGAPLSVRLDHRRDGSRRPTSRDEPAPRNGPRLRVASRRSAGGQWD